MPFYEPDDGPLTQEEVAAIRSVAARTRLAAGKLISQSALFPDSRWPNAAVKYPLEHLSLGE